MYDSVYASSVDGGCGGSDYDVDYWSGVVCVDECVVSVSECCSDVGDGGSDVSARYDGASAGYDDASE